MPPKGNQVTDIDFQPVNKVLRDRNVQYMELEEDRGLNEEDCTCSGIIQKN